MAMPSGLLRPNRFGTSSPITSEKYVMTATTNPKAILSAYGARNSIWAIGPVSFAASVAPPNAPAKMPTSVMPICTVERKRLGASASSSATFARPLPWSARRRNRAFFEDTTAISAIAKTPFAISNRKMMAISRAI